MQDDEPETGHVDIFGSNFDCTDFNDERENEAWEGTLKGLHITACTHRHLSSRLWIEYAFELSRSRSARISVILKFIVDAIKIYVVAEATDIVPMASLFSAMNFGEIEEFDIPNEQIAFLEEMIRNRADKKDNSCYFISQELMEKDLVIQLNATHTNHVSADGLLLILRRIMPVTSISFLGQPSTNSILTAASFHMGISSLTTSLNRSRHTLHTCSYEALIRSNAAVADGQELRRRMGPLNEAIFRQAIGGTDGEGWVASRTVRSLNDLISFVGKGIKANEDEQLNAKECIVDILLRGFKDLRRLMT